MEIMKKEYKIPFYLFLLGLVFALLNLIFGGLYWAGQPLLFIISMVLEATALIILILNIYKKQK